MIADSPAAHPLTIRREDYRPPAFAVPHISLLFDLDDRQTQVEARFVVERRTPGPLALDLDECVVRFVSIDGVEQPLASLALDDASLTLPGIGDRAEIVIRTQLDPSANTKLMGLYMSGGGFCTQCEAEGFRRIVPFLDRPDVMSRYRVEMRADKARFPVLLANGNPVAQGDLPDGRHFAVWDDPFPKPTYLFALVASDLAAHSASFTTMSGRTVALNIWVKPADLPRCDHAMQALIRSMRWDEEVFGREYDLDIFNIVAVADFNFGAMENKGLNIFNSKYILADAETATDLDFDGVEGVVAHEYFHNWSGNRVTCRDWFQLSLKEGLTVYRDQEFSADMGSRAVKRIDDVRLLRAVQFQEDAGPLAHPVRPDSYQEISNFYTATVYNKGAELIRMMATLLGPNGFRAGMDLYFERHDGEAVTCDDFVRAMEDASGVDLVQFRRWYGQAGTPEVVVEPQPGGTLRLIQRTADTPGQSGKLPVPVPVRLAWLDAESGARIGDEQVHVLNAAQETLVPPITGRRMIPSLLRGFSAPVQLSYPYSRADLAFLAAHDDDAFARWEAMQRLALDLIEEQLPKAAAGDAPVVDPLFINAVSAALADPAADPALIAEAALLPTESYIGDRQAGAIDVDAIHAVRQAFRQQIGVALKAQWQAAYHANSDAAYALTPEAKARRRLKNVALQYLAVTEEAEAMVLVARHYHGADNMTDSMAALTALASSDAPQRQEALAHFYERWQDNALVIDKWFTVQAFSFRADTLEAVRALTRHPAFTIANPNRLRSLVNAFAGNQVRFHGADGGGYRFLADHVVAVDRLNPQAAARLVAPLGRWQRFDAGRSALMRAELERIARSNSLSRDVREMVGKSLG